MDSDIGARRKGVGNYRLGKVRRVAEVYAGIGSVVPMPSAAA